MPPQLGMRRDEELVFSCRLVEPMLRYFEEKFGAEALASLVEHIDTPLTLLRDPDQWLSTGQLLRLSVAMVEASHDPLVTYRAGLELLHPSVLGTNWFLMRALGGPGMVYGRMAGFTDLSRITQWKLVESAPTRVTMRFEVADGHRDHMLFCLNRQGALAGIPRVFDMPLARVSHPYCIHEGAPFCEYQVEWIAPPLGQGLLPWLAGGSVAITTVLALLPAAPASAALAAGAASIGLLGAWIRLLDGRNRRALSDQQEQLTVARTLLDENLARNRERILLEKVDQLTRRETDSERLVNTALNAIRNTLGYDRAMFLAVNTETRRLEFGGGVGLEDAALRVLGSLSLKLDAPGEDELLFANILRRETGELVADVAAFRSRVNPQNQALLDRLGSHAFIAVPVRGADGPLGLLVVDQVNDSRSLGARDHQMLQQVGNLVGLALANAKLVGNLRRERQVLEAALLLNQKISQYLPRTVVDSLSHAPDRALQLGGQRRRAAVLFSDIVGFTPWSELAEPETAVAFLNWYFGAMDQVVDEEHGILDKRIGDGMMVVFLEGEGREPPARRALRCGMKMQAVVRELNRAPRRPREDAFALRIGVSYGEPVAGNLGSAQRMEYTVIGDTVNVASRLEGRCEPGAVLATAQAVEAAGPGVRAQAMQEYQVKGRTAPVVAWEIVGVDEIERN